MGIKMSSFNEYVESFFKSLYFFELERADKLIGSLSLPIAIITALLGAASVFLKCYIFQFSFNIIGIIFTLLTAAYIVTLVISIYYAIRVIFCFKWSYIATPSEIATYITKLEAHYKESKEDNIEEKLKFDLVCNLSVQYQEKANNMALRNDARSEYKHRVFKFIIISLSILLLNLGPYIMIKRLQNKSSSVQKIEIINLNKKD